MFGVVLWSDSQHENAVIWCEDHGELAYYRGPGSASSSTIHAGDLIQFDLDVRRQQRIASNPKLISEGECPDLAAQLRSVAPAPKFDRQSARIIRFPTLTEPRKLQAAGG